MCICVLFHFCRNRYEMPSLSVLQLVQEVIRTPKLAKASSAIFTDSGWRTATLLPTRFLTSLCCCQHFRIGCSIVHVRDTSQQSANFIIFVFSLFPVCVSPIRHSKSRNMPTLSNLVTCCSVDIAQAVLHRSLLVVNFRPASLVQMNGTTLCEKRIAQESLFFTVHGFRYPHQAPTRALLCHQVQTCITHRVV
jgi:hypothetical protein